MLPRLTIVTFLTVVVLALGLVAFCGPVSRRVNDYVFAKTTEKVVTGLPADERAAAQAVCDRLWDAYKTYGVTAETDSAFAAFRRHTFLILEDDEVSTDEARRFVREAEDVTAVLESGGGDIP